MPVCLRGCIKALRSELRARASLRRLRRHGPQVRQLELGSGPTRRPGWITVDQCAGADLYWDLRRGLPFADSSFDRVYCSHLLEHFDFAPLRRLLREVLRVLRPGAEFLIAVPDAALYVDAYLGKIAAADLLRYQPAVVSGQRMDILNYMFYMDGHHRFMFDRDSLAHHCTEAGFQDCAVRAFDPQLDASARDYESLYMICTKPAA